MLVGEKHTFLFLLKKLHRANMQHVNKVLHMKIRFSFMDSATQPVKTVV